jgi:hypothetical protein
VSLQFGTVENQGDLTKGLQVSRFSLDVNKTAPANASWECDGEMDVGSTFLRKVASNLNAEGTACNLFFPVEAELSDELPANRTWRELGTVGFWKG